MSRSKLSDPIDERDDIAAGEVREEQAAGSSEESSPSQAPVDNDRADDRTDPIALYLRGVGSTQLLTRVMKAVATLPPRDEAILRFRFGIGGMREHTLEEVGERFSITRERVRQIEQRALTRLRTLLPELKRDD